MPLLKPSPDYEAPRFHTVCFARADHLKLFVRIVTRCLCCRVYGKFGVSKTELAEKLGKRELQAVSGKNWFQAPISDVVLHGLFSAWYAATHPLVNDLCGLYAKACIAITSIEHNVDFNGIALTAPECFHIVSTFDVHSELIGGAAESDVALAEVIAILGKYGQPRDALTAHISAAAEKFDIDIRLLRATKPSISTGTAPDVEGPDGTLSMAV